MPKLEWQIANLPKVEGIESSRNYYFARICVYMPVDCLPWIAIAQINTPTDIIYAQYMDFISVDDFNHRFSATPQAFIGPAISYRPIEGVNPLAQIDFPEVGSVYLVSEIPGYGAGLWNSSPTASNLRNLLDPSSYGNHELVQAYFKSWFEDKTL